MIKTLRFGLLVAIIVLSINLAPSNAGSYLDALHKPAPSNAGSYMVALNKPAAVNHQASHLSAASPHQRRNSFTSEPRRNSFGRGGCSDDYKFDYLMLTLQWGPGFCATSPQECKRKSRLFTIHGMWPQFLNVDSPSFCCFDNTFVYEEIEPLMPSLNKYWFSYYDKDSRRFWSHEWLKHGTCAKNVKQLKGEQNFFGTTLKIVKQLPIAETLQKSGIVPDQKKAYNSQDIINSLRQLSNNKNPRVDCDLEAHQPTPILKGVNFCFDADLKFIDCPPSKSRCQRQLIYLD